VTHPYKKVRKAVLPVAGLGTRLLPATKVMPKEMLTIVDRPLIQMAIEEALQAGIEEFIFVVSDGKEILLRHFEEPKAMMEMLESRGKTKEIDKVKASTLSHDSVKTAYQKKALGLGHAVWCAKDLVGDEPFAVILPDDTVRHTESCLAQMMHIYDAHGGNIIASCRVLPQDTTRYGMLAIEKDNDAVRINGLVEKPKPEDAPSDMGIFGRYILQPEIFAHLERHEKGAGGEIQLTDAMAHLVKEQPFYACEFKGERLDCGNDIGFVKAQIAYALDKDNLAADLIEYMTAKLKEYKA